LLIDLHLNGGGLPELESTIQSAPSSATALAFKKRKPEEITSTQAFLLAADAAIVTFHPIVLFLLSFSPPDADSWDHAIGPLV
jgi:hypothetical protein